MKTEKCNDCEFEMFKLCDCFEIQLEYRYVYKWSTADRILFRNFQALIVCNVHYENICSFTYKIKFEMFLLEVKSPVFQKVD